MTQKQETIDLQQQGLKCDTPTCDYTYIFGPDDTYTKWLNAPCPKCGSNLLTQEDHDTMVEILALIDMANSPDFEAPALPQEIQELVDQLEQPDMKVKLRIEFVDGVPTMTSDDEEVQSIIEEIEAYYRGELEVIQHLDNLEKE